MGGMRKTQDLRKKRKADRKRIKTKKALEKLKIQ